MNRPFTLILPYYLNPTQLQRQYARIAAYSPDVREDLSLIVCDDGSPNAPAVPPDDDLGIRSFQLYRVEIDIRWNWLTCRNIGVHHADTDWVLMTDIDHEMPEQTARRIQRKYLDENHVYRFNRVDAPDLTPYKPHPNTWLMTKVMFDKIGGYDERFSGAYGSDGEFRDRVRRNANVVMLKDVMIRVPREVVPDASTTTYLRKQPEDHEGVTKARALIAQEGGPPRRRSFPYHRVA